LAVAGPGWCLPSLFDPDAKRRFRVDVSRSLSFLGLDRLTSPRESIESIVARATGKGVRPRFLLTSKGFKMTYGSDVAIKINAAQWGALPRYDEQLIPD